MLSAPPSPSRQPLTPGPNAISDGFIGEIGLSATEEHALKRLRAEAFPDEDPEEEKALLAPFPRLDALPIGPMIVPAIAVPQSHTTNNNATRIIRCKGRCGEPLALAQLCPKCQTVVCLSCSLASAVCPKSTSGHQFVPVDYLTELQSEATGNTAQVEAFTDQCLTRVNDWLLQSKNVRIITGPNWRCSTATRVDLYRRICAAATLPEVLLAPENISRIFPANLMIFRTDSEPVIPVNPMTTLAMSITFPGHGCVSLIDLIILPQVLDSPTATSSANSSVNTHSSSS